MDDTNPETVLAIRAGRIAIDVFCCVLVTVVSLSWLWGNLWRMFLEENSGHSPLLRFAFTTAPVIGIIILLGVFLRGDNHTRKVLLPTCILMPLDMTLIQFSTLTAVLFPLLNLLLLPALIPCVIESITRKKPFLGIAAALCAVWLLAGLYTSYLFWYEITHIGGF